MPGLVIGVVLALVIRPAMVGLLPAADPAATSERTFMLFAGLKGAVPILLGGFLLGAHLADAERLYGIVVVVVVFSVLVQGGLVPAVARLLELPMRVVEPQPWALGVRLNEEPDGAHRFTIAPARRPTGAPSNNSPTCRSTLWISLILRDRQLLRSLGTPNCAPHDEVLVLADPELHDVLVATFGAAGQPVDLAHSGGRGPKVSAGHACDLTRAAARYRKHVAEPRAMPPVRFRCSFPLGSSKTASSLPEVAGVASRPPRRWGVEDRIPLMVAAASWVPSVAYQAQPCVKPWRAGWKVSAGGGVDNLGVR